MTISYTYVIIDVDLIINDMVNEAINNENSYRKSKDGTKAILKFNIKHPNTMPVYVKYTYEELLVFLDNNEDWDITIQ